MTPGRFQGRVALVTAGASGIGLAIVERLVAEGAKVVVGDIDGEGLQRLAGPNVEVRFCDASHEDAVQELVGAAAHLGGIDCAFNVAGLGIGGPLTEMPATDWDRVISISLRSCFLCLKHEARHMISRGRSGAIVNIASINAIQPAPGAGSYNAAKAGVVNLTQSAAIELGPSRIRVNAVGPGLVQTPMTQQPLIDVPDVVEAFREATPLQRYGQPADVAAAATFLASDEASWITGQTLYVDGGQTVTGYPNLLRLATAAAR